MILIFFIIGLIIGSFLGAANYRLKTAEDIVFKRSHCPICKHDIRWYDNIPLLSFVILFGRCRDCKKYISWEYPLIELMTGLLFAGVALKFFGAPILGISGIISGSIGTSTIVDMSFLLFAVCYLVLIFWHDYDYMLISDAVVFPAIIVTFFYQIWKYVQSPFSIADFHSPLTSALVAALGAALFFFFLIWVSKGKWIGGGDVKLGFLAGLVVGWPKILFVLFSDLSHRFGDESRADRSQEKNLEEPDSISVRSWWRQFSSFCFFPTRSNFGRTGILDIGF